MPKFLGSIGVAKIMMLDPSAHVAGRERRGREVGPREPSDGTNFTQVEGHPYPVGMAMGAPVAEIVARSQQTESRP
ncbi:hypothetical protein NL676_010529 [Syzygium grande]|nr:hypothetical protein NL676_010529 [Syzygium grande]